MAQIAINDPLQLEISQGADQKKYTTEERSDRKKAEAIVAKFRDVFDLAQAWPQPKQNKKGRQIGTAKKQRGTRSVTKSGCGSTNNTGQDDSHGSLTGRVLSIQ
ncbi:hypothetical protein P3342_004285 [Pyrenophora teres f. teres]|nr:hypothetical protein P3342_005035 [Pyrenophora teres f. teres]KAK1916466.1 hypothetical protein P3342_004285 [Pyrenophora teres f. teres]